MERQLRFLEPDERPGCSDAEEAWRLDEETRRRGRDGVAAARRALAKARRHHAA